MQRCAIERNERWNRFLFEHHYTTMTVDVDIHGCFPSQRFLDR